MNIAEGCKDPVTIDEKETSIIYTCLDKEFLLRQLLCGSITMEYSADGGETFQDYTSEEALKLLQECE